MKHPFFFTPAIAFMLTGCGGSVTPSNASSGSVPAGVVLKSTSGVLISALTFSSTGASNAQAFVAAQPDGSSPLHESDTCASSANAVASVQTQSSSDATSTYIVSPLKAGACTITVSGANGSSATLGVSITITNVPIQ